ncbi:hypothetical protein N8083_00340 [Candidatus Pacebacteria bacterium]|nr:hypothetical protein [Candidatus Paceibacterota bacterium]
MDNDRLDDIEMRLEKLENKNDMLFWHVLGFVVAFVIGMYIFKVVISFLFG